MEEFMGRHTRAIAVLGFCALAVTVGSANELKPKTLAVFERYVQLTEARMAAEVAGSSPFLWIDRQPERARLAHVAGLKRGEVVSERLETRDGPKRIDIDDGLIHHWVGTVFLPGTTLARATAFVQNYERYPELFAPMIQRAKVLTRSPEHFDVAMRTWAKNYGVTVVIDADYGVTYRRLSASRLYTRSVATNVFQVESAGASDERRTPGDQARGFLWRLNTYCWFEERSEGTYEQCESVSLTADAPFIVSFIVRQLTNGIPRDTLAFTLGRVREGVVK
jgi:hypothetical protein